MKLLNPLGVRVTAGNANSPTPSSSPSIGKAAPYDRRMTRKNHEDARMMEAMTTNDTVLVRLKPTEAAGISAAASEMGLDPDEWVLRLVRSHLNREPQWDMDELDDMAEAAKAIKQIRDLVGSRAGGPAAIGQAVGDSVLHAFIGRVKAEAERRMAYWGVEDLSAA